MARLRRLTDNPQFRELATRHADRGLAEKLHLAPGDGRLKMYLEEELNFTIPELSTPHADGTRTIEAHKAAGHPGEFVGDAYIVSAGRTPQTPPEVGDMIIQVTSAGGEVKYRIDLDALTEACPTPERGRESEREHGDLPALHLANRWGHSNFPLAFDLEVIFDVQRGKLPLFPVGALMTARASAGETRPERL